MTTKVKQLRLDEDTDILLKKVCAKHKMPEGTFMRFCIEEGILKTSTMEVITELNNFKSEYYSAIDELQETVKENRVISEKVDFIESLLKYFVMRFDEGEELIEQAKQDLEITHEEKNITEEMQ